MTLIGRSKQTELVELGQFHFAQRLLKFYKCKVDIFEQLRHLVFNATQFT
ncbi:uncharacterized protein PHALS_13365 [Plasmopara halstedii]|uniref:Uncharacterized protein n=1 Tax=Plasmopara halstedii TaxID=4781 RepID=A0A0P1AQI1_PLAHL|nr:uncharacterized protein PHALS_13365 [Plasmopara halstedii]CEG43151.1 hypothetical protein PHALS_13365 [Plasmopara halstedii]|eukprot:XP_024579520.1 hypothetical protein PHALS_13365 [Plasmopara halstedii]